MVTKQKTQKIMLSTKVFKNGYKVAKGSEIAKNEENDCIVRAIANSFEIDYDSAHSFAKSKLGRKDKKGTTNSRGVLMNLKNQKLEFEKSGQLDLFCDNKVSKTIYFIGDCPKMGGKLRNRSYTHKDVAYTVKTFMDKFKKGTYFLIVNKHALVCKDGVLIDNPGKRFAGYRRVVESAFTIQ